MLFKLSLRNIRRSLKDYAIYFFTLVLGVAIFYIFNSLESQTVMMEISQTTHSMIDLMKAIMPVLSIFVAVVLGSLIIYASRFLMKRRKKEFGIYMTLGMSKVQISRILLIETFATGLFSLAVGLIAGIFLSQFTSILVANMFEADMTGFQFVFSLPALLITVLLFGIIYLVVMVFNTITIGRQRLINLLYSDKLGEKVKIKNLGISLVVFILSIIVLVRAYIGVTVGDLVNLSLANFVMYVIMGIIGTFLLFWSWSGLALRLFRRFKNLYYRNLNMFIFREIDNKINTTVVSMSIISLMLFLTISILSSATSLTNAASQSLQKLTPADFQAVTSQDWHLAHKDDPTTERPEEYYEWNRLNARETLVELGVDIEELFSKSANTDIYRLDDVTLGTTTGKENLMTELGLGEHMADYLSSQKDWIMKISDYNQLAEIYNLDRIELGNDEYAVVSNQGGMVEARNAALKDYSTALSIDGRSLRSKYDKVVDGFWEMSTGFNNMGFLVIPDDINFSDESRYITSFIGVYKAADEEGRLQIDEALIGLIDGHKSGYSPGKAGSNPGFSYHTKTDLYENSIGTSALASFIGLYLGSIFLITSAALLGLKEISESSDNQEKYLILRKIGVDQKVINRTLLIQIGIFFGLPLLVAIVHSIFGIAFANRVIVAFGEVDLLQSILATASFILAIYGGYFLITYFTAKRFVAQE